MGEASMGKTLFSIPEESAKSYNIRGLANRYTDFKGLSAQQSSDTSIRIQDHRSHMNKHRIKEMIEKGY